MTELGENGSTLKSFLSNRLQRVKTVSILSNWIKVFRGVPQGAILGPLLFNIYVKDLRTAIDSNVKMIQYADDCLVFASNKVEKIAKKSLESNINNLKKYFRERQLYLNSSKTKLVYFSKQNDQRNKIQDSILVDIKVIKKSKECKYLGLTIDSSLSFMNQVKPTSKKMAQGIKTIDSFGIQLPTSSLEILLHSIVLSHLNYSIFFQHIRKPVMTSLEKQLN